jgi:hypothetical protein
LGLALNRVGLDVILTKGRSASAVQPETVDTDPETEPRTDKIAAIPAAALDRRSDTAASAAAVDQTQVKNTDVILFEFNGSGREYFKIWLVNIILTVKRFGKIRLSLYLVLFEQTLAV